MSKPKKIYTCSECGREIKRTTVRGICKPCRDENKGITLVRKGSPEEKMLFTDGKGQFYKYHIEEE